MGKFVRYVCSVIEKNAPVKYIFARSTRIAEIFTKNWLFQGYFLVILVPGMKYICICPFKHKNLLGSLKFDRNIGSGGYTGVLRWNIQMLNKNVDASSPAWWENRTQMMDIMTMKWKIEGPRLTMWFDREPFCAEPGEAAPAPRATAIRAFRKIRKIGGVKRKSRMKTKICKSKKGEWRQYNYFRKTQ